MDTRIKKWRNKTVWFIAAMLLLTLNTSAAAMPENEPTQTAIPKQVIIELGEAWAGVEFELRTDLGVYPGNVAVNAAGVLQFEVGDSDTYTLSCAQSSVEVPKAAVIDGETQTAPLHYEPAEQNKELDASITPVAEFSPIIETEGNEPKEAIPIMHVVLFGGGLIASISGLIFIKHIHRRREEDAWDDE